MSLEVCSSGHDEIIYNGEYRNGRRSKCPLCEAAEAMEKLVAALKEIQDIEAEATDTPEQVADFANYHWRDAIRDILP
jgi:HEAT repeat protein